MLRVGIALYALGFYVSKHPFSGTEHMRRAMQAYFLLFFAALLLMSMPTLLGRCDRYPYASSAPPLLPPTNSPTAQPSPRDRRARLHAGCVGRARIGADPDRLRCGRAARRPCGSASAGTMARRSSCWCC